MIVILITHVFFTKKPKKRTPQPVSGAFSTGSSTSRRPLEPAPAPHLAREFMLKMRRRKGLSEVGASVMREIWGMVFGLRMSFKGTLMKVIHLGIE